MSTRTWLPHICPASLTSIHTQLQLLWAPPALWPTWWHHRAQRVMQYSTGATHQASSTRSQLAWATACCPHPPCTIASTRPSLPTRPTSAPHPLPLSTLDTRWAPPRSTSTLTSREDIDWHWRACPALLLPPKPSRPEPHRQPKHPFLNLRHKQRQEEHAILMELSRITWRCNDREKKKKKIHDLSRREKMGLIFRGVQFKKFLLIFVFSERASFCFYLSILCFTLWEKERLICFTGKFETGLLGQRRFSGWFSLILFPLLNLGSDCWTGVTDWKFGIPRDLGEGEIRKPAALQRKKNIDGLELS